jgi:hypothetical protein
MIITLLMFEHNLSYIDSAFFGAPKTKQEPTSPKLKAKENGATKEPTKTPEKPPKKKEVKANGTQNGNHSETETKTNGKGSSTRYT